QNAGDHTNAMVALGKLVAEFPDSIRVRDAKFLWATSAIAGGQPGKVEGFLSELNVQKDPSSLLLTAKAYESLGDQRNALNYYRRTYFYGAGTDAGKEAETKLTSLSQNLAPQNAEEATERAERLFNAKRYTDASTAYADLAASFPA